MRKSLWDVRITLLFLFSDFWVLRNEEREWGRVFWVWAKPSHGNRELRLAEQQGEEADCYSDWEVWKRISTVFKGWRIFALPCVSAFLYYSSAAILLFSLLWHDVTTVILPAFLGLCFDITSVFLQLGSLDSLDSLVPHCPSIPTSLDVLIIVFSTSCRSQ